LSALQGQEGEISETHVIGHAHGNDDIAKDTPSIPHLQAMSLDNWEQTCVVVHMTYGSGTPKFEGHHFGDPKRGVIFLFIPINPNCYPTPKLNERELCTMEHFYSVQILNVVDLFRKLTAIIAPASFFDCAKMWIRCA